MSVSNEIINATILVLLVLLRSPLVNASTSSNTTIVTRNQYIAKRTPLSSHEFYRKRRVPLPIRIDPKQPIRLNILMCGVGHDVTGGPLSIFYFAILAANFGFNVRWISINDNGISKYEMMKNMNDGIFEEAEEENFELMLRTGNTSIFKDQMNAHSN